MDGSGGDSAGLSALRGWAEKPTAGALAVTLLLAAILFPYWWLAVQWAGSVLTDPETRFAFTTTTFLLVLVIADSAFLVRYYQLLRNRELEQKTCDLRRSEDALRTANEKLNLLSNITRHDILNQITALKGYIELMQEEKDPGAVSRYIEKQELIAGAIENQINFTRDYQEMGAQTPAWQNVAACVEKAKATLPVGDIRITVDREDLEIFADPIFERVFYNLIDNALRYGGPGLTTIRISSAETEDGLILSVEDDGVGVRDQDKERIFARGFGKNTGFGLFLCREILSLTGIRIQETGEPGKGACFEMLVPKGNARFDAGTVRPAGSVPGRAATRSSPDV